MKYKCVPLYSIAPFSGVARFVPEVSLSGAVPAVPAFKCNIAVGEETPIPICPVEPLDPNIVNKSEPPGEIFIPKLLFVLFPYKYQSIDPEYKLREASPPASILTVVAPEPLTSKLFPGELVPIPTFPSFNIVIASVAPLLPTKKCISAPVAPTPDVVWRDKSEVVPVPPITYGVNILVENVGLVASATTVPLPVVLYDVPQALPVEFGIPEPGYTIPLEAVSQVIVPEVFVKTFVPEVEVTAERVFAEFAARIDPEAIDVRFVPPWATVTAAFVVSTVVFAAGNVYV